MGTGRVIPQPEEKPQEKAPKPPTEKCSCGHKHVAHFDADGNERPCVLCQDGKVNVCVDYGGYRPPNHFGPWKSKWAAADKDLQAHEREVANET